MFLKNFFNAIRGIKVTDDFYDDLEETLILSDIGAMSADEIVETVRDEVDAGHIKTTDDCMEWLKKYIADGMRLSADAFAAESGSSVYMLIGVNGVGKTTTVGKLAAFFKNDGKKVLLAAADTFRAAAGDQLKIWGDRAGVDVISGADGSDPGAVIYDACQAARARKADILLCDTAGRLHNKKNLMAELKKLYDIAAREFPEAKRETLVVLDATTGQNALEQARQFMEIADVSGIVLTKTDGTAKGGIAYAIMKELGVPVKYIGVGEKTEDIRRFDPAAYAESLLGD